MAAVFWTCGPHIFFHKPSQKIDVNEPCSKATELKCEFK